MHLGSGQDFGNEVDSNTGGVAVGNTGYMMGWDGMGWGPDVNCRLWDGMGPCVLRFMGWMGWGRERMQGDGGKYGSWGDGAKGHAPWEA